MITLTTYLPENFHLVSIMQLHTGLWNVCVKHASQLAVVPGDEYGSAQHASLAQAAELAVMTCTARMHQAKAPKQPNHNELASMLEIDL